MIPAPVRSLPPLAREQRTSPPSSPASPKVTEASRIRLLPSGEVVAGRMRLSSAGRVASQCWRDIPKHFPRVTLDVSVVMPDHVHGIVVIGKSPDNYDSRNNDDVGAQHAAPLHSPAHALSTRRESLGVAAGSLGAVVRAFKSATTK